MQTRVNVKRQLFDKRGSEVVRATHQLRLEASGSKRGGA